VPATRIDARALAVRAPTGVTRHSICFCLSCWQEIVNADTTPGGPCGPAGPAGPVGPAGPCGPAAPSEPATPGAPSGPGGPATAGDTVSASDVESASPALLLASTRQLTSRPASAATGT
jgi:hypothetical protein